MPTLSANTNNLHQLLPLNLLLVSKCKIASAQVPLSDVWRRRQSEIDAKARDVRLQRALEEVERFKALLQEQRVADKDQKDVSRSEYSRVFAGDCCHIEATPEC